MTVNHDVAGSSPASGVKQKPPQSGGFLFCLESEIQGTDIIISSQVYRDEKSSGGSTDDDRFRWKMKGGVCGAAVEEKVKDC